MKRRATVLKLISTPELPHPYQVVREDGLPDVVLTLFAEDLLKSLSPSSRAHLHAGSGLGLQLDPRRQGGGGVCSALRSRCAT
jgi:hypothetical protein